MLGNVVASLREMLAMLGVSIETLIFVLIATAVLATAILTGPTARIGVWFEDLMYRLGVWGG